MSTFVYTNFSCRFVSHWLDELTKIFMQVFFVVTFLSLFFFLYVVKVEKEIFDSQITFVVDNLYDDLVSNIDLILPPTAQKAYKEFLYNYVTNIQPPTEQNQDITNQNNQVLDQTKNLVVTFAIILFGIVTSLIVLRFCTDFSHQFLENIIILGAIALTEYTFLNVVTRKYISANPSLVKYTLLDTIQQYATQKQTQT